MVSIETVVKMANDNSLARMLETFSSSPKLRVFVVQMPQRIDNKPARIMRIAVSVVGPCLDWNFIDYELDAIAILRGHRLARLRFRGLLRGDADECSVGFNEHGICSKCLVCSGCDL
jgi:hypothetical protein